MSNRNIGPCTKCPLRGQSRPGQIPLMIFHLEAKTCPSLNAQRRQIAEVEWLNFLNKILVENQSLSAASSFKPSACLATRPHWASLCLSRTRGVQEGEPRASAGQSELARQNTHLARRTQRSPCIPQAPFLPCRPSPSPCPQSLFQSQWSFHLPEQQWVSFGFFPLLTLLFCKECLLPLSLLSVQISPVFYNLSPQWSLC